MLLYVWTLDRLTANEKEQERKYTLLFCTNIYLNIYKKKWFVSKAPMAKVKLLNIDPKTPNKKKAKEIHR